MYLKFSSDLRDNCHVLISISIGQENQTGEFLTALLALTRSKPQITKVTILKADTLQRHQLKVTKQVSEEEAYNLALEASVQWEADNADALNDFKKIYNAEILNWDTYQKSSSYADYLNKVNEFYQNNSEFQREVKKLSNIFAEKNINNIQLNDTAHSDSQQNIKKMSRAQCRNIAFEAAKAYILEECAVFIMLSEDDRDFDYKLFRGERNYPLKNIHNEFVTLSKMSAITILTDKKKRADSFQQAGNHVLFRQPNVNNNNFSTGSSSLEMKQIFGRLKFTIKIESQDKLLDESDFKIFANLLTYLKKEVLHDQENKSEKTDLINTKSEENHQFIL